MTPLALGKDYAAPSVFRPENLLREARRQKKLALQDIPALCILDPDGDLVRYLHRTGAGRASAGWACYHTALLEFELAGRAACVVGCAVGAPFAVLVAEQMFQSGCLLLISVTSAGWIGDGAPPQFMVIERALRDEGVSHHYLAPGEFSAAPAALLAAARDVLPGGVSWTTDAPYRETEAAIAQAKRQGAVAVEMEAAGLYAFATAQERAVLCVAHITNAMAQMEGDFEKGEDFGAQVTLAVLGRLAAACGAAA